MADKTEQERWPPAFVNGNQSSAVAVFDEDERGDLIDIRFYCLDCAIGGY